VLLVPISLSGALLLTSPRVSASKKRPFIRSKLESFKGAATWPDFVFIAPATGDISIHARPRSWNPSNQAGKLVGHENFVSFSAGRFVAGADDRCGDLDSGLGASAG
jgi:hypothetical protein